MSSKLRTLAVLWMVLGPDTFSIPTKLLDLGSSMDGFGPNGKNHNRTAGPQQFYGWFWALWIECHQNCRPWQFYGWFWAQQIKATKLPDVSSFMDGLGSRKRMSTKLRTLAVLWMVSTWWGRNSQVSNIKGFIIKFGLWYYGWLSFSISLTTKHVEKHM